MISHSCGFTDAASAAFWASAVIPNTDVPNATWATYTPTSVAAPSWRSPRLSAWRQTAWSERSSIAMM